MRQAKGLILFKNSQIADNIKLAQPSSVNYVQLHSVVAALPA